MAFDELQKEYSSRLFKTILRMTKNWEDAEDALRDTFLRAYLALPNLFFRGGGWRFSLELKDSSSNPEQVCDLRQRKDHMLRAIRNLESPLRAPIEAQLAGGYSVKEVADTLNISVAAAKARLYRARVRLLQRASVHSVARKRVPARFVDTGAYASLKSREQQWTTCG
jgi:RNA polymerase sigma-70 factor (ECF subfamily)